MTLTITVGLGVRSPSLETSKLAEAIGYPGHLVTKGSERIPSTSLPKTHGWNGGLVLKGEQDTGEAVRQCLAQYPNIVERVQTLKKICPDVECTLHISLRPFSQDFILFLEKDSIEILGQLECQVSIEYFNNDQS